MGQQKTCTICHHADRGRIDELLAAKVPLRQIADRFGVGRQSLYRHAQHGDRSLELAAERNAEDVAERRRHVVPDIVLDLVESRGIVSIDHSLTLPSSPREDELKRLQVLTREKIPISLLAERLLECVNASKYRFFSTDGRCTDVKRVPDHAERRAGLELTFKVLGYQLATTTTETLAVEMSEAQAADKIMGQLRMIASRKTTKE